MKFAHSEMMHRVVMLTALEAYFNKSWQLNDIEPVK